MSWRGEPIPLNRKTFDLLLYLVDRRDRVASKDELLKALWPDQFVEESNLTQHIFLLRKALSRHESGAKFIETIPGRGYRFTASVEAPPLAAQMTIGVTESITRIKIEEETGVMEAPTPSSYAVFVKHGRFPRSVVLALLAVGVLFCCGLFLRGLFLKRADARAGGSAASTPRPRPAVAVLGFHNSSNRPEDAWLSTAVAEMLASEMTAGDDLRVIPTEDVVRAESDLGIKDSPIDTDPKRASLSRATGADMLVKGSYVVVERGSTPAIRLMVQLQDAHTGKQVALISKTGNLAELFKLIDEAGAEVRNGLSQRASRTEEEEALSGMSRNTEALRLYAEGVDRQRNFDAQSARSLFERAVQADPNFAMAHLGLADAWSDLGFMERAAKESAEAYKLSTNLPRAERLAVEADYRSLSNDSGKAISLYKALSSFYPDNQTWSLKLAAAQREGGQQKDIIETLERIRPLRLTPAEMVELDGLEAGAYGYRGDPQANEKARAQLDEAVAIADKQGGLFIHGRAFRYKCFVLSHIGPVPAAQAGCEQAKTTYQALGNLEAVADAINNLGVLAQQIGDWQQAQSDYEDSRRLYHQLGNLGYEVDSIQNLSLLDISHGELARALQEATELSRITGTSDDYHTAYEGHYHASVALLLAGRLREARAEALEAQRAADKEHPWDFKVYQQARSRDMRGWVAFRAGDLSEAQALYHEALTLVEPTHDEAGEATFITDEASVALEQGRHEKDVLDSVRHAAEVLAKLQDEADEAVEAEITLAGLDLQAGATAEATQAIAAARKLDSAGDSLDTHLDFLLGEAELQQALGHANDASNILKQEVDAAKAKGFIYSDLAGEIALARLDAKTSPSPQNASRLQSLGREAERAGFKGLARKALAG
jgi:DNA-binding winged helix-turn-helix (wHTH) protein/tetratricopeptide (TPR) repeat protein